MINYLALLGWGYDETTTFFTIEQLQELFSLERVSKNPAVFDEQKLRWINGRYVRELSVDDLTARLEEFTGREGLKPAVEISQEKISTLCEFWPLAGSFYDGPTDDPKAREKFLEPQESKEALAHVRTALAGLPEPWTVSRGRGSAARNRRADGAEAKVDFPAFTGRFDRYDRFTRYLRNGRAAGARGDPREGGACA